METSNKSFNESWKYLLTFHPPAHLPKGESLDLTIKPKVSQKEWGGYIDGLINVLKIGSRNSWLHVHVDGKGRFAYLYVPEDIAGGAKIIEERIRG